jgi:hypothetical protein
MRLSAKSKVDGEGEEKRTARENGAKKWQQHWNNYKGVALSTNIVRDETRGECLPPISNVSNWLAP